MVIHQLFSSNPVYLSFEVYFIYGAVTYVLQPRGPLACPGHAPAIPPRHAAQWLRGGAGPAVRATQPSQAAGPRPNGIPPLPPVPGSHAKADPSLAGPSAPPVAHLRGGAPMPRPIWTLSEPRHPPGMPLGPPEVAGARATGKGVRVWAAVLRPTVAATPRLG